MYAYTHIFTVIDAYVGYLTYKHIYIYIYKEFCIEIVKTLYI